MPQNRGMSLLLIVLSLVIALTQIVPASSREFYVSPTPTANPSCPQEEPCHTLNEYALNSDQYFEKEDEISLLFLDGDHDLTASDLKISNKATVSLKPVYLFNIVSIEISDPTSNNSLFFENISELYMYGVTITKYGLDDIHSFQVSHVRQFTGQLLALAAGGLIMNVHSTELLDSLLSWSELEIRVSNVSVYGEQDELRPSLTISGCELSRLKVDVQDSEFAITLTDNTVPQGITNRGNSTFITVNGSTVYLNVSGCDISSFSDTGISIHSDHSPLFQAYFENTTIFQNPVGFSMTAKDSNLDLTFKDCHFDSNSDAIHVEQNKQLASAENSIQNCLNLQSATASIILANTTVSNNHGLSHLPAINVKGIVNMEIRDCRFVGNTVTPIGRTYEPLVLSGSNVFANNTGLQGGALSLISSQLCLANNSHTTFHNNSATDVGGAMYVERLDLPVTPQQCFYQVPTTFGNSILDISVTFENNKAGRGGDDIYGVALNDTCVIEVSQDRPARTSVETYMQFFKFAQSDSLSRLSSDPNRVCLCNSELGTPECANISYIDYYIDQEVYPGEDVTLSVVVVGEEFGTLTSTVYASYEVNNDPVPILEPLQTTQGTNYDSCTTLTYTVYADDDVASPTLVLNINEARIDTEPDWVALSAAIESYQSSNIIPQLLLTTPVFVTFDTKYCPLGFELKGDLPFCDCSAFLATHGITDCSVKHHRRDIFRSGTQWIGKESDNTTLLFSPNCPFFHCKEFTVAVDLDSPDTQCKNGRSDRLCGACAANFSQVLGGTECQRCTNDYLALVIVFAVAGVALVCFNKLLDMTVTTGTINGLIFYANIIWDNQNIVLAIDESPTILGQFLKVFLAWLNLDLGITTCFFDGMTAYWKAWLQYIFPVYIWTVAGIIILASHLSFRASRLFGNNSVHVLATLFILSFSKILQTIITSLSFTYIIHQNGYLVAWTEDGTIDYLNAAHSVLFAVALCSLLFLWAPFMLTLLFIQPLRKVDHFRPFRWTQKWKPLFDAYTGPLKDKFHYWTGILLLARAVVSITHATTIATIPRASFLITAIVTALLSLHTNMYKKLLLSLLEKSFLLNVCALTITLLYLDNEQDTVSKAAVVTASLFIAFIQFVGIAIGHVIWQVKKRRVRRNAQNAREFERVVANHTDAEDYREPLIDSD